MSDTERPQAEVCADPQRPSDTVQLQELLSACCPYKAPSGLRAKIVAEVEFVALTWVQRER